MLLGGGFPLRQISLLYGEASTGKTILSMQCALEMARKDFRVFYVDADQSFSAQRLERMIGGPEFAEKIVLFRPGISKIKLESSRIWKMSLRILPR